ADVAIAIDAIIEDLRDHEISRRVKAAVPPSTFRLSDPVTDARRQVEQFSAALLEKLSALHLANLQSEAMNVVDALKQAVKRRELFDGKRIIDEFFRRHLHSTGMSREIFVYSCAREARSRKSVASFIVSLFKALNP